MPPDPSTVRFTGPWTHRDIHANGIRFHVVETAPDAEGAPLVLMLHGFADFWWSWRHQLTALADQGLRPIAVDLRGYGDSDKPPRGYDGWTLAGDIAGLIRALGYSNATLVGHADGGLVGWVTAVMHPRLVRSIVAVSSPHPRSLKRSVLFTRAQRKVWLPDFLNHQKPMLPERQLTRDDGAAVEEMLRLRTGEKFQATAEFDDVVQRMRAAVQIPGVAHCAMEYQRWAFRSQWRADGRRFMKIMDQTISQPTFQIRGADDNYILESTLERCARYAPRQTLLTIPEAAHFAHQEQPDAVTETIVKAAHSK
ncbi:MAG: alpha/beta hydrolase [Nocardiaceae bacterium]|nr:alpha/beta hydrolase [Nocardiaceae bacterium]